MATPVPSLIFVGEVGVLCLAHCLHPHLEFIGFGFIGIPRDRNTGDVVGIFVLA